MNYFKFLPIIFLMFLLSGCNGVTDAEVSINSNLKIVKTNPQTYSVNYLDGEFLIEPVIEEVNWDQFHLIAKRKIREDKFEYWIIQLENVQIYGPLSETEYLNMIKDLNIDLELKPVDEFF
mgnify:CR=1 FL=1